MTLFHMFDASQPPEHAPAGFAAVAGYLGGNTPHVWTLDEWNRFPDLRKLPIWVKDGDGYHAGEVAGESAAMAAHRLGWRSFADHRRAIACDMETSTDASFVHGFNDAVRDAGYVTFPYGSASSITGLPPCAGYWVARWDHSATLEAIPHTVLHQYAADVAVPGVDKVVDLSVGSPAAWERLGRGPRHGV